VTNADTGNSKVGGFAVAEGHTCRRRPQPVAEGHSLSPKATNSVGVGAGVNRPSLRTVCAVFPRTALPSTQGQP